MVRSFAHKGLERFFKTGSKAGINPKFAMKLELQLTLLNAAKEPGQMDLPGYNLHQLRGDLAGHWSIKVDGNWRLTFRFAGEDVERIDLQDYH